jgi:hypothetical protein
VTTPSPARRGPGRPPNPVPPPPEDDSAADLRTIVGKGRDALGKRMDELCALSPSEEVSAEICTIMKEVAVVMNGVRRLDEASTRKIPPFRIVKALRDMSPDERAHILEQFGAAEGGDGGKGRNVLGG